MPLGRGLCFHVPLFQEYVLRNLEFQVWVLEFTARYALKIYQHIELIG